MPFLRIGGFTNGQLDEERMKFLLRRLADELRPQTEDCELVRTVVSVFGPTAPTRGYRVWPVALDLGGGEDDDRVWLEFEMSNWENQFTPGQLDTFTKKLRKLVRLLLPLFCREMKLPLLKASIRAMYVNSAGVTERPGGKTTYWGPTITD